jgi:DNA-binding NarL/FixJ family response regulator
MEYLVTPSAEALRVLIADDHPLFRNGMRALLNSVLDLEVVGEATTGDEVIILAAALQPDVILMDLQMPGVTGIEATRRILLTSPHVYVLVVTMFEDDDSVFAALRAGARGYVLKGATPDEMLRAIRAIGSGEAIFSPAIAQRLIDYFGAPRPATPVPAFPDLTEREQEILARIARGQSNPDIARQLIISLKTVRNHVSNIFSKLQVTDRAEAIMRARDAGLDREGK